MLSLLFWGLIVALILGGTIGFGVLFFAARAKRWRKTMWLSGFAAAVFALAALAGATLFAWGYYRTSTPSLVFEDTFHRKPPPGTVVLEGSSGGFADSASIELSFKTDRVTFDAIRPRTLHLVTEDERSKLSLWSLPKWWKSFSPETEIWYSFTEIETGKPKPEGSRGYFGEITIMTWDSDGLVQYSWSGID